MSQACAHSQCADAQGECIFISTSTSPSRYSLAYQQAVALRSSMSIYTSTLGVANCGMEFLIARQKGNQREVKEITDYCKNKHVCPTCMRYSYWKLSKNLSSLITHWQGQGKGVFTQTLTIPSRPKSLIYKHQDLARVWTRLGKSKAFYKLKEDYGLLQYLKVTEDVLRVGNSFPHLHVTWFFSEGATEESMADFSEQVSELWAKASNAEGVRGTMGMHQWYGPVQSIEKYSSYVAKHGYWNLAFDTNNPKNSSIGLKPLEFLRSLNATGDYDMLKVWLDYEQATRGRQRIRTSNHFQWAP